MVLYPKAQGYISEGKKYTSRALPQGYEGSHPLSLFLSKPLPLQISPRELFPKRRRRRLFLELTEKRGKSSGERNRKRSSKKEITPSLSLYSVMASILYSSHLIELIKRGFAKKKVIEGKRTNPLLG